MMFGTVDVDLPDDRIRMRCADAIEVQIWIAPVNGDERAANIFLAVNCQAVIDGFTIHNFDRNHNSQEGCEECFRVGWVNDEDEAYCYRLDDLAMGAFVDRINEMPELRMFKDGEHMIESDHWTIAVTRRSSAA